MSFDIKLETVCNHRIFRELVTLASDRRSIRVAQPITSTNNVEVYASNNLIPNTMYNIVRDPEAVDTPQNRMIFLNYKWKAVKDYFEISYTTLGSYCPKCAGLNIINDISYNIKGDLITLTDERLLLQNLEKFVVTEKGSNSLQPAIGTYLFQLVGQKINDGSYLTSKITQQINATLATLKSMQQQYQASGRPVTSGELLMSVNNINVSVDSADPEILRVDISATAQSGKPVYLTQYMRRVV